MGLAGRRSSAMTPTVSATAPSGMSHHSSAVTTTPGLGRTSVQGNPGVQTRPRQPSQVAILPRCIQLTPGKTPTQGASRGRSHTSIRRWSPRKRRPHRRGASGSRNRYAPSPCAQRSVIPEAPTAPQRNEGYGPRQFPIALRSPTLWTSCGAPGEHARAFWGHGGDGGVDNLRMNDEVSISATEKSSAGCGWKFVWPIHGPFTDRSRAQCPEPRPRERGRCHRHHPAVDPWETTVDPATPH